MSTSSAPEARWISSSTAAGRWPNVIKDYEHYLRVWNGPLGKKAKDFVLENGSMVSRGTVFRGLRQTTANEPILGPDDLTGVKLRLPVVPTWQEVPAL